MIKNNSKDYICNVCKRKIPEKDALMHIKSEEYMLKLIERDHPNWPQDGKICKGCINYYRKLVKDAKI
ncbi:MAG: hypothetical protein AB1755_03080 [Candidatus Omnitrophota bacterium]